MLLREPRHAIAPTSAAWLANDGQRPTNVGQGERAVARQRGRVPWTDRTFMAATAEAQAEATREAQRAGIAYARAMDPQSYRGRKPSFDREQLDAIRDMLAQDVRPSAISKATGVSRQTVYRIRDDPTKAEAILLEWAS